MHHSDAFGIFWANYPRREAKKDALKAWAQVHGDQHLDRILDALIWQAPQWTERQYTPLPASYLRGERWEDEPPLSQSPRGIAYECPHVPACASRWACGTRQLRERQTA